MAIVGGPCNQYILNAFLGLYDHTTTTGDVFKCALLTSAADRSPDDVAYSATGESSGTGYVAGGVAVAIVTPVLDGIAALVERKVIFDVADAVFEDVTIADARGCQYYNSTVANDPWFNADFGSTLAVTAGDLTVQMPAAALATAIMRL